MYFHTAITLVYIGSIKSCTFTFCAFGNDDKIIEASIFYFQNILTGTVNARLPDTLLLRTLAITDKIQISIYRGLTENDSRDYGHLLLPTQNDVQKGPLSRLDCMKSVK